MTDDPGPTGNCRPCASAGQAYTVGRMCVVVRTCDGDEAQDVPIL